MSESVERRARLEAADHRLLAYAADLVARGDLPYRVYDELMAVYFPRAKKKGSK